MIGKKLANWLVLSTIYSVYVTLSFAAFGETGEQRHRHTPIFHRTQDTQPHHNLDAVLLAQAGGITQPTTQNYLPTINLDSSRAELIFHCGFETEYSQLSDLNLRGWKLKAANLPEALTIQSEVVRSANCAIRNYLRRTDWDGTNPVQGTMRKPRAQLTLPAKLYPFELNEEYWIGLSTLVPSTWINEKHAQNIVILWQFHGDKPGGGSSAGRSPPLALEVRQDTIRILNRTGEIRTRMKSTQLWLTALDGMKGKWVDWEIRVKFSFAQGVVQIWKEGERIVDLVDAPTV
jgi:Polysaccharide lyase